MSRHVAVPVAIGLMLGGAAFFAAAAQEPVIDPTPVTLTGCIEAETTYRLRVDGGNGPVVRETDFVLTSGTGAAAPGSTPSARLTALLSTQTDYALTGALEPQMDAQVGGSVQITGVMADVSTGRESNGVTILPRVYVSAWQAGGGACTP
jgi:hypothetical protein